jgi:hypothetical protein
MAGSTQKQESVIKLFKERLLHWHCSSIPGLAFHNQKKYLGQLPGNSKYISHQSTLKPMSSSNRQKFAEMLFSET